MFDAEYYQLIVRLLEDIKFFEDLEDAKMTQELCNRANRIVNLGLKSEYWQVCEEVEKRVEKTLRASDCSNKIQALVDACTNCSYKLPNSSLETLKSRLDTPDKYLFLSLLMHLLVASGGDLDDALTSLIDSGYIPQERFTLARKLVKKIRQSLPGTSL